MGEQMYAGSTIEKKRPTPDKIEKDEEEKFAAAMGLMREILNEFGRVDFTLDELEDSLREVNEENLKFLVDEDMLLFNDETEEYSVNHNSPHIANMETDENPDRETEWGEN